MKTAFHNPSFPRKWESIPPVGAIRESPSLSAHMARARVTQRSPSGDPCKTDWCPGGGAEVAFT